MTTPRLVLSAEEVQDYKCRATERLKELIGIAEDAEQADTWTEIRTPKTNTKIQKMVVRDTHPVTKNRITSTMYKCEVDIPDTSAVEVLLALARYKTKEYQEMMEYLHGTSFVDGHALLKFPSSPAERRPDYSFHAIKWCAFEDTNKGKIIKLDFSFLEYAGTCTPSDGSKVVGFCLQESLESTRQIPLREPYVRGYLSQSGILLSKIDQSSSSAIKVTAVCQIDGDIETSVRRASERIAQDMVGSIVRIPWLLFLQRLNSIRLKKGWERIATENRSVCAVCLKRLIIAFHIKYNCSSCGEVVCSSCLAPKPGEPKPTKFWVDPRNIFNPTTGAEQICISCTIQAGHRLASTFSNFCSDRLETLTSADSSRSHTSRVPNVTGKKNSQERQKFVEKELKDPHYWREDLRTFQRNRHDHANELFDALDQLSVSTSNTPISNRPYAEEEVEAVEIIPVGGSNNYPRRPSVPINQGSATGGPGERHRHISFSAPGETKRPAHERYAHEDKGSDSSVEVQVAKSKVYKFLSSARNDAGNSTNETNQGSLAAHEAHEDLNYPRRHHGDGLTPLSSANGRSEIGPRAHNYLVTGERTMGEVGFNNRESIVEATTMTGSPPTPRPQSAPAGRMRPPLTGSRPPPPLPPATPVEILVIDETSQLCNDDLRPLRSSR